MTTWPSQMTLVGTILGWMPFFMSPLPLAPRLLRVGRGSVMSGGPQRGLRAPRRRAAREMLAHGAERAPRRRPAGGSASARLGPHLALHARDDRAHPAQPEGRGQAT